MVRAMVAVVCVTLLAGCAGEAGGAPATGNLSGRLVRVGGPAPGAPVAVHPGVVTLSGPVVRRVRVGVRGRFAVSLPVGTYAVGGASAQQGLAACRGHTVTVATSHASHVRVVCAVR